MFSKQKTTLLIYILLFIGQISFAQKVIKIRPYSGANSTLNDFKIFSQKGFDFGISADYYLTSKFALGIDVNKQDNKFINPFEFSRIPDDPSAFSLNTNENGKWNALTITFGPTYSLGAKKFKTEIYSKAGTMLLKTPNAKTTFSYQNMDKELFLLEEQNQSTFGLTSGIRFNYEITNHFSLFVNPQYVYSSAKINYLLTDYNPAFFVDGDQEFFDPGTLIEQEPVEKSFSPSYFNLNFGVSLSLGNKRDSKVKSKKSNNDDIDETTYCSPTGLKTPLNKESFSTNKDVFPVFEWYNYDQSKVKNYIFKIFDSNNQLIFKKTTSKNSFKENKKLESLLKNSSNQNYRWNITTNYKVCEPKISKSRIFTVTQGDCDYFFTNDFFIECDSPAYDPSGNVKYKGYITVENNSSLPAKLTNHTSSLNSSHIDVNIGNLTTSTSGFPSNCPPIALMSGNLYSSGQVATYCFELSVPIGTTTIDFLSQVITRVGTNNQAICDASKTIELPSCICNLCDEENGGWDIVISNKGLIKIGTTPDAASFFLMGTDFKIINADNIKGIKAEIISVQHEINDPQCHTCTKNHTKMGLFKSGGISGKIAPTIGWKNNGIGDLSDKNNDNYGNEYSWCTDDNLGVDFSTIKKRISFNLSLPELSTLDCCHSKFTICVRYTFTDINCLSCSKTVCYEYDSSQTSGGIVPGGNGSSMPDGSGTNLGNLGTN